MPQKIFLNLHNTKNIYAKKLFPFDFNPFLPEFILFQSNEIEIVPEIKILPDTASLKTAASTIFVDMAVKVLMTKYMYLLFCV